MNFKVGSSLTMGNNQKFDKYVFSILKLIDYKFGCYLNENFVEFKLSVFFDKKNDGLYDYLKAMAAVSFLSGQKACIDMKRPNAIVLSNINGRYSLFFLRLLLKKYFTDEEFRLMFEKHKFVDKQWNFAFKNISGLFDLSFLPHDYYLWKYPIQVVGSFEMSEEVLFVFFSGYNIKIAR
jgi:hypothetical protein